MTNTTMNKAYKKYCDLKVQAMLFDMDIDIETGTLVPKETFKQPGWIVRWQDKLDQSDVDQVTWDMELE